jgi:hypothetical protein
MRHASLGLGRLGRATRSPRNRHGAARKKLSRAMGRQRAMPSPPEAVRMATRLPCRIGVDYAPALPDGAEIVQRLAGVRGRARVAPVQSTNAQSRLPAPLRTAIRHRWVAVNPDGELLCVAPAISTKYLSRPYWTETITHLRRKSRRCPPSTPPEGPTLQTDDPVLHQETRLDSSSFGILARGSMVAAWHRSFSHARVRCGSLRLGRHPHGDVAGRHGDAPERVHPGKNRSCVSGDHPRRDSR